MGIQTDCLKSSFPKRQVYQNLKHLFNTHFRVVLVCTLQMVLNKIFLNMTYDKVSKLTLSMFNEIAAINDVKTPGP